MIYPRRVTLTETWSLKPFLNRNDLQFLERNLLVPSIILPVKGYDIMGSMTSIIYDNTTLKSISINILINLKRG